MEGKNNIVQYRGRMDRTLASHDLANEESLKILVKNQILQSSKSEIEVDYIDNVVENRTKEVSNIISMMSSAAMSDNEVLGSKSSEAAPRGGWKIKQDTQEYRVMYREGPQGTPFHTLLVEGYVDGPIDVCLCISTESVLYKKWWPQSNIPTFKIISSECLQKVRIGEQISLVRMKVSWPLSAREAVVHYFVFEYFKDDLVIVLLKSISDLESINKSTHGFTKDGIPVAQEVVRIDLVGGFALQKVTADRTYFRTIANMDIKLDFVPPALINFISRQLIGSGFKLYQKEVASVAKGDEEFSKALKGPLYTRIREALYSANKSNGIMEPEDHKSTDTCILPEEHIMRTIPPDEESNNTDKIVPSEIQEIEEDKIEESGPPAREDDENLYKPPTNQIMEKVSIENNKKKVVISREVEQALGTLEKVIYMFREYEFNPKTPKSLPGLGKQNSLDLGKGAPIDLTALADGEVCSKNDPIERTSHEMRSSSCSHGSRHMGSNSYVREANHNRIAPASPEEHIGNPTQTTETLDLEKITNRDEPVISVNSKTKNKKKARFCCLHFIYGQQMA